MRSIQPFFLFHKEACRNEMACPGAQNGTMKLGCLSSYPSLKSAFPQYKATHFAFGKTGANNLQVSFRTFQRKDMSVNHRAPVRGYLTSSISD